MEQHILMGKGCFNRSNPTVKAVQFQEKEKTLRYAGQKTCATKAPV